MNTSDPIYIPEENSSLDVDGSMLLFELFIIRKFPPIVLNNLPLKLGILIYKHFERKNAYLSFIHKWFSIRKMSGGQCFDNDLLTLYCRKHSNHFHMRVEEWL